MSKYKEIKYKIILLLDIIGALIVNLLSLIYRKKNRFYILIYSPYREQPWILNRIINDIKESSDKSDYYRIFNSLFKLSLFKLKMGGNLFSMHQSNINKLSLAGFKLNNISTYYTHTKLHQKSFLYLNKLDKIFCQNIYELSFLKSNGIDDSKLISFPVGIHGSFVKPIEKINSINERDIDVLFSLKYIDKISHYRYRKRYDFIIKLSNKLVEKGFKVFILGEGWENIKEPIDRRIIIKNIAFKKYNKLYRNSKIFCNCSLLEGGPISLIEAYASGCLILTTPVGLYFDLCLEDKLSYPISFDKNEKDWFNKIVEINKYKFENKFFKEVISLRKKNLIYSQFNNLANKLEKFFLDKD